MLRNFFFFIIFSLVSNSILALDMSYKIVEDDSTEKKLFTTLYYKFHTGQYFTIAGERYYYGFQNEMQPELNKYEITKRRNISEYRKFSRASFFQTDVFEIPVEIKQQATEIYTNLLDSIFKETDNLNKVHIEILIVGYTDESPIIEEKSIYKQLLKLSKKENYIHNEYYNDISFYRAYEVAEIMNSLVLEQKNKLLKFERASLDIIIEGRGIEFPEVKRNYSKIDKKRRIAKVYWRVLNNQ